jgi:AcrR family transcriptional regulator
MVIYMTDDTADLVRIPTLQEQKQEFTRTRLIDAAAETFGVKGFASATIDDIASAAGCSRATFYLYFQGKAAVMLAMVQRGFSDVVLRYTRLDEMLAREGGLSRPELREWLASWLDTWSRSPELQKAIRSAEISEPSVADFMAGSRVMLVDALEKFFARLPTDERDYWHARAIALEAMSRTAFELGAAHRLQMSDDQVLDYLTDLWADIYLR